MRIVTDSSTLYSPAEGKELGITVIPACTVNQDKTYKDFIDISCEEFLELIERGSAPTTSQPSIGDLLEVFEDRTEEILHLSLGDGLSGAYQTAMGAKNSIDDNDYIHVIDTKTLGGPQRYLVQLALSLKEQGLDIATMKEELQKRIETSVSFVIPADFEFLRRSGRLTPIAAKLGGLLKIVPVLTQTEDMKRIEIFTVKRSRKKALQAIAEHLLKKDYNENCLITVSHAGVLEHAQSVVEILKNQFTQASFEIYHLSPSLIAHGGPGSIVVQAIRK